MPAILPPDDLSEWMLPPQAVLDSGETDLIRTFDSAASALAFLARYIGSRSQDPDHRAAYPARARRLLAKSPRRFLASAVLGRSDGCGGGSSSRCAGAEPTSSFARMAVKRRMRGDTRERSPAIVSRNSTITPRGRHR